MLYFSGDDLEIAGASPETLVKVTDGEVRTFPLAGTRPRGKTPREDLELERELLADEKELAEHNMLVDLGRNDLGKISRFGTVSVDKYLSVERFSHVMHIGSEVHGQLKPEFTAVDAVDAVLPAGTLSGARRSAPARLSMNWRAGTGGFTGEPSATWILPEIWIPVFPSGWHIREKEGCMSAQAPGSLRILSRKRNMKNAGTRRGQ